MAKTKAPRFFKFTGLDGKEYSLTLQQKLFVEEYLEWKGDGVEAIIEAGYNVNYKNKKGEDTGVPNRKLAAVIASQNLIKLNICAYVTLKLDEYGFNVSPESHISSMISVFFVGTSPSLSKGISN